MKKHVLLIMLLFFLICFSSNSEIINTVSPDKNIVISFKLDDAGSPNYSISYRNSVFIEWSKLGLNFINYGYLGTGMKQVSVKRKLIDETFTIIAGKSKYSRNYCNETTVLLEEKSGKLMGLYFRAYNDGAAFRYGCPLQPYIRDFVLSTEETRFNFAGDYNCWALKREKFRHSYEGEYKKYSISKLFGTPGDSLKDFRYISLPLTMEISRNFYACLSEAGITDYAGMYLINGNEFNSLKSVLSPDTTNKIAAVRGKTPFVSPWRVFIISDDPGGLIESNIILNLNEPSKIPDASSWVRPGKSTWSWWAEGRGFEADFNYSILSTHTVKYYIDFAERNSIEYVTLDGGWYGWFDATKDDAVHDITKTLPELDLPEVARYAASKGIGIFLWVVWYELERQFTEALDYYQSLEIKGIKVDFMDRDDQYMVDFYHKTAIECAKRKMLVNFHGAYKPDGLERTYPNIITREAILGNEYARWITGLPHPEHNVTIPFTRMVAGGMDYTPGSMRNATQESYIGRWKNPMTKGTRAQQMAMLVVYRSGIISLCESPKIYEPLPEFNFIKQVPAAWDSTIVLDGEIGDFITIARKKDGVWFLAAMTDWTERKIDIDFSFLGKGNWTAEIYRDADDANINPQNVVIERKNITGKDRISFNLAKGGGLAVLLRKN